MLTFKSQLEALGIDLKRITSTGKTTCPKCSSGRKKKNDPCLSVNIIDGVYKCHNCDFKGRVFEKIKFEKKDYIRPVFNNRTHLSEALVNWFASRSITQQTLIDFKVTESVEWMPQVYDLQLRRLLEANVTQDAAAKEAQGLAKVNTINFNYFRDSELINIKYRDSRKNFKLSKNAELIFYNLNSIREATECIICEGEIDAMSWHQAGYIPVLSVPNGATLKNSSDKNPKLEYLDNCIQYFENKTKIYISNDNDEPGRLLRDELARRLGLELCYKIDLGDCKDANEYLVAHGPQKLLNCIKSAQPFPITGVFSVSDLMPDVMDFYYNGLPEGDRTGDVRFDDHLRFMPGELTLVTGIPSHGKTIFLEDISLKLCINADWSFGIFSPESYPIALFISRLIKKVVGRKVSTKHITPEDMLHVGEWLQDKYHVIYPENEDFLLDTILSKAAQLVKRKGINGLIIDPWNRIETSMPNGYNPNKFTAEQLIKITKFNQRYGVHTFLVAHPTKMPKDTTSPSGNYSVPTLYNISGSSEFFNIAQNGLAVFRNMDTNLTEVHVQKVKWENTGKKGMLLYRYCDENTRLLAPFVTQTEIRNGCAKDDFTPWIQGVQDGPPSDIKNTDTNIHNLNLDFIDPNNQSEAPF